MTDTTLAELASGTILELDPAEPWDLFPPEADEAPGSAELECDECGRSDFKNDRGLRLHRSKAHSITAPKADKPPKLQKRSGTNKMKTELHATVNAIAMLVQFVDPMDAAYIAGASEQFATAWANLAERNATVHKVLTGLTATSTYGEVIVATAMMMMPILLHHGWVPQAVASSMFGVTQQAAEQGNAG